MNIVLFSNDEIEKPLPIKDTRAQHIKKILHKTVGETFDAGIINGKEGLCTIKEITNEEIIFDFKPTKESKPLLPIILIVGFPRPIQLKRLLRDVSSLGVCAIHLTGTELGEKSYLNSTILKRGAADEGILDGAIQAKTTQVPELLMHQDLKKCIEEVKNSLQKTKDKFGKGEIQKILLDNVKPQAKLSDMICSKSFENSVVVAAIGSERGWTDKERNLFENEDFKSCSLGQRILRTETACTTAVSLILAGMSAI